MTGSTVRGTNSGLRQHQLPVFAGGILCLDGGAGLSSVTPTAKRGDLMRRSNAVRFGVPLGTPVLHTVSVTGVAIQALLRMRMRQEVLHCFAVAHFAEVAGLRVCKQGCIEQQNQQASDKRFDWLPSLASRLMIRVHLASLIRHSCERRNLETGHLGGSDEGVLAVRRQSEATTALWLCPAGYARLKSFGDSGHPKRRPAPLAALQRPTHPQPVALLPEIKRV